MEVEPAMKKRLFALTLTAAVATLVAGLPFTAAAQAWPGKPVRMVIPFPAGGATDIIGRVIAQKLGAALGQQVMDFSNWFGVFAPAGTPPDIVARLNRELNTIVKDPEVVTALARSGAEVVGSTPAQLAKVIRDEHDGWKGVIQRAGIKAE